MLLFDKPLELWQKSDIESIINDSDYNEKLHVDYKKDYNLYNISKDKISKREKEKNEIRNDICSFANADGGFIIYGIKEEKGVPIEITGSNIIDKDRFELEIRNIVSKIEPSVPTINIIEKEVEPNKKIQIIKIYKGIHTPYTHCGNNNYYFYVRDGNGKRKMSYKEVQTMYNQSIILEQEIDKFRSNTINFLMNNGIINEKSRSCILEVIPSVFMDKGTYIEPFNMILNVGNYYDRLFNRYPLGRCIPNVDGVSFVSNKTDLLKIFKNNVVQCVFNLDRYIDTDFVDKSKDILITVEFLRETYGLIYGAIKHYKELNLNSKVYLCYTVLGCKGVISDGTHSGNLTIIDRNKILGIPIELGDYNDEKLVENAIYDFHVSMCLSLGIGNYLNICGKRPD